MCFNIHFDPSNLFLSRNWHKEKLSNFARIQFFNDNINQNIICQFVFLHNCQFYHFWIEVFKISQLSYVSVSMAKGIFETKYSRNYLTSKARKIWRSWKIKTKFWSVWISRKINKNKSFLKNFKVNLSWVIFISHQLSQLSLWVLALVQLRIFSAHLLKSRMVLDWGIRTLKKSANFKLFKDFRFYSRSSLFLALLVK